MGNNDLPPDDSAPIVPGNDARLNYTDPGPVPDQYPSTSTITPQLDAIASDIATATADAIEHIDSIATSISDPIYAEGMGVNTVVSELSGGIDGRLSQASVPLTNLLDKTTVDISRLLIGAEQLLLDAGVNYPTDPYLQTQVDALPIEEQVAGLLPGSTEDIQTKSVYVPTMDGGQTCLPEFGGGGCTGGTVIATTDTGAIDFSACGNNPQTVCEEILVTDPVTGLQDIREVCHAVCEPPPAPPEPPPPPTAPPPFDGGGGGACCPDNPVSVYIGTMGDTNVGTPVPTPVKPGTTVIATVPPVPPPPPPPVIPPPPDPPLPPITTRAGCRDWDTLDVCNVTYDLAGGVSESPGEKEQGAAGKALDWMDRFISSVNGVATISLPGYVAIEGGRRLISGHGPTEDFAVQHDIGVSMTSVLIDQLTGNCVHNKKAVTALSTMLAGVSWAERITGAPLKYLAQSQMYSLQFLNPQNLIGQTDTDNLYLRNYIDDETWTCLTKANGDMPGWHRSARDAKQTLLSPDQLIQLWRRKAITRPQLNNELSRHGFISGSYKDAAVLLSEMPLTPSDLTTGMVRDVFDEKVVKKYEYDKDFDNKFSGKAEEWAYWQGLSREQYRYIWRMHWKLPSDGQFFEMLHRLRPDRAEVVAAQAANAALPEGANVGEIQEVPPVVTQDDVKEALEINDLAPAWVDKMIAISYHPITMTDATRAYMIGYFDKSQLNSVFQDNGYTANDASILSDYWEFETNKRIRSTSGVLTPRKVMRLYKIGAFNAGDAKNFLRDIFPNAKQLDKLLNLADKETVAEDMELRAKALKRSYMTGEIDQNGAGQQLKLIGIDPAAQARLVRQWEAERQNRSKEVTAMMLCKWADRGLIKAAEHRERLHRLGYPVDDANRIARVCEIDTANKRAKQAARDAKAALAASRRELLAEIKALEAIKKNLCQWLIDQGVPADELPSICQEASNRPGGGG